MKENNNKNSPTQLHLRLYKGFRNSGIKAFDAGRKYIMIEYKDGRIYLYNYKTPGEEHVRKMIGAAYKGEKLGTYINKYVRDKYAGPWDDELKRFILNKN